MMKTLKRPKLGLPSAMRLSSRIEFDAGGGCGVDFENVDEAPVHDGFARFAVTAGVDGRAAGAVGADAVQALGDDACSGRLACAAHARQHEGVRDAVGGEGVAERADHDVLADQVGKGLRPVFPGKDAVGGGFGHGRSG